MTSRAGSLTLVLGTLWLGALFATAVATGHYLGWDDCNDGNCTEANNWDAGPQHGQNDPHPDVHDRP